MTQDSSPSEHSNDSADPAHHALGDPMRRTVLRNGTGLSLAALLAPLSGCAATANGGRGPSLGFKSVPPSAADKVVVPEGYSAQVLAPWGDPVGISGNMPAFKPDASNSAAEQAVQMGMHHDGMHFYPLGDSRRGLLAINHEYTDDGLLHTDGQNTWTAEKVKKAQAAHGMAVIEVELQGSRWQLVRPSPYARRITANTPCAMGGPAAGHTLMRTAADPAGRTVLGTLGNCAAGITPWGTYLTGEETSSILS